MDSNVISGEEKELDRAKTAETYGKFCPLFESLIQEAVYILNSDISAQGIKIHSVEHRVKTLNSVLEKCLRKNSRDPFTDFSDIAGVRIICLLRSDLAKIQSLVTKNFEIISSEDKIAESGNPLGYVSIHMICKMKSEYKGPRYNAIAELKFEVQLRTLCMHCWAAVSHYLDYKGEWDVPAHMKLSLNALGGLFFVADNEFEQVYGARIASISKAEKAVVQSASSNVEIDLDTLTAYLARKFSKSAQANTESISELVQQLKESGYHSLAEVDRDLDRANALNLVDTFNRVGVVRIGLQRVSAAFTKTQKEREAIRRRNIQAAKSHKDRKP